VSSSIKIIDNFLSKNEFVHLKKQMFSSDFPWYYNSFIVDKDLESKEKGFQFTHSFFTIQNGKSDLFELTFPIFQKLNPKEIFRVKSNLGPRTKNNEEGGWHIDFTDIDCKTAVFYINNNNGYTLIKDENGKIQKVESVENRLVEFDSKLFHTGVSQTDTKVRCLINLNYIYENQV
jgi:hypothetical protein